MTILPSIENTICIDLGFIGHKANELQSLFDGYSQEPNEYGYFLKFENYSEFVVNQGVTVWTNCFESLESFQERLMTKLLFKL
jgi:hypothetical protein